MIQEIYIIDDDESSIIIINEDAIEVNVLELCQKIRRDEDNSITPIIVVSSNSDKEHRIKILQESVEYYIKKPVNVQYLYYTIKNLSRLLTINRRISPLTGLPGNVQIHAELKKRISNHEEFSVLYLDLDNFKAYNDVYGFLNGDEIIKFTADTIIRCVHENMQDGTFVGHIGGDDFDAMVGKFFTEKDRENGYIEVENRKGIIEKFPLTSISIGVVEADNGRFANMLEIGEVGAQVKHLAKSIPGSSYSIDRRKNIKK